MSFAQRPLIGDAPMTAASPRTEKFRASFSSLSLAIGAFRAWHQKRRDQRILDGMSDMHRGSGFGDGGCGGAGSLPIDCFRPNDYPEYYAPTYHVSRNKHTAWCKAHYRTYVVSTNKFTGKSGKKYRCNSPYDRY